MVARRLGEPALALFACASLALTACAEAPASAPSPEPEPSTTSTTSEPPPPPPPQVSTGHPPNAKPPANVVGTFTIDVPAITLAPGEERQPCYIFPLDVTGPSRVVGGGSLTVGPGLHHGNITTRPKTGEGVRPCPKDGPGSNDFIGTDILNGGAVLFGSSTQVSGTEWQSFPEGMGYTLRDGYEIVARMHYLNVTAAELTVAPKYEWFTVDEAKVKQLVGPFAWQFAGFEIPPLSEHTVVGECDFPAPMRIVNLLPHMHKLGTGFTAAYLGGPLDGELFLDSKGYDPESGVMVQYDDGVDLSQGDGARFSCAWKNTHEKNIVEGVGDDEMCILFGYAWPPENAFSATASSTSCYYLAPPPP